MCMLAIWTVTLWFLSASSPGSESAPKIPHLDKIAHFSYFLCGGAAFAAFLGLKWPECSRFLVFTMVSVVFCLIGRLDEYHQSFTPGRSANDIGDWIADCMGAVVGGLLVITILLPRMHKHVKKYARSVKDS